MPRAPYALAAAIILVRFADEWTTFLPAGALEPIRHDLGLTYAQAGLILAALPAGGLVGNFFVVAADYVSRRWLAALGAAGYGVAMIGFGLGHSLFDLLAAAFAWGAASDAFISGCEVALVDLAGDKLSGALARMNAWAAFGDLLGPATLALTAAMGLRWRSLFETGGAAMLAYAAWIASQDFPPPQPRKTMPSPLAGVVDCLKDRRVLLLAALMGLFGLLDEPLLGFTIAYLERVRGFSQAGATLLAMVDIVGAWAGFTLFDRLFPGGGGTKLTIGSAAIILAALPAMIFAPVLVIQVAGALAFGVAGAVFYTRLQSAVLAVRPGQAGSTSAVVAAVGMAGLGFPALAGWTSDAFGLAAGLALYAAVPLIILGLTLAAPQRVFSAP